VRPDVLCCRRRSASRRVPLKRFKRLGYGISRSTDRRAITASLVSKLPFETTDIRTFCDKLDSRHISVSFGEKAQLAKALVLHNFYVRRGDIRIPPQPEIRAQAAISSTR